MHDRVFKHTEAHKLEDPERLRWLPPAEVISHLRLLPGMKIADIGAGTGYFSIPIARAVGDGGRVLAADLQPEMLELLHQKLSQEDALGNIELVLRRGFRASSAWPGRGYGVFRQYLA